MTAQDRIVRPRSACCGASREIIRGNVAPDPEASIERPTTSAEATDQKVLLPGGKCLLGTDDDNFGSRRARDFSQSDAASGSHV